MSATGSPHGSWIVTGLDIIDEPRTELLGQMKGVLNDKELRDFTDALDGLPGPLAKGPPKQ